MVAGEEPNTWDRIFDQNTITELIIERNKKHFSQAHGTPFTVEPLVNWAGWHGTSDSATEILNGNLPPDVLAQTTEAAGDIMKSYQQDIADPDSIPIRISTDDLRHGIKSWKETTSTSPSGRHLGYYHSILAYEPPPVDADTPRDSDRILGVIANLIDSALQTGFVFARWCEIVNAMIEKIPGRPLINKLRVIHLSEADLNLSLGIL
jgi:hypothetical protein